MQTHLAAVSTSGDKGCSFLPGMREEDTFTSQVKLLGRWGMDRELFLCLLFLNCLQLKRILVPKWHILGWHIVIPFMFLVEFGCSRDGSFPNPTSILSLLWWHDCLE